MYLTASRLDIMFAVCACSRFQVTPKTSHLKAVKRIFRYLKGKPKLGFWYPRESTFDLVAYTNSDYGGVNLDRKSTTGGCQFLGHRLISWQCKKQTIMATSTTKAEYVAAAHCCGQFWTSAKSRTVNNISYIDATIASKPVTISEASIRSDLLFDDADGIATLNNQAILDTIQLMGYEGDLNVLTFNKALFSPQWKFLFHIMNHCISSKSTSWDQIPTNIATTVICLATNQKYNFSKLIYDGMMRHLDATKKFVMYPKFLQIFLSQQLKDVTVPIDNFPLPTLTKKVLSFMIKKGKNFSGKVTPLFDSMLVPSTEDEGEASERPSESQLIPSPTHPSTDQLEIESDPSIRPFSTSTQIPTINPEGFGGNIRVQSSSDRSLSGSEDGLTLQSVYDLCVSLCKHVTAQAGEIKALKAKIKRLKKHARQVINHHKAWCRAGRKPTVKSSKGAPSVVTNTNWDAMDRDIDDTMDYTLAEDEENAEKQSTEELNVSTDKSDQGTNKLKVSTDKPKVSTDSQDEGTDKDKEQDPRESTTPTTPTTPTLTTTFGDDETIAQVLITMSQNKEKLKEKEKGVELKDVENIERPMPTSTRSVLTLRPLPKIDPKAKGKGRIEEEDESDTESEGITEAEKKFKQLAKDEEVARKVQDEWEAEEERKRLGEEEATKAAVSNEYDFIQARLNADKILAEKIQEEEREMYTVEQRAKFLYDTIVAQRRFLAQQRLKKQDQNFVAIGSAEDERKIKEMNEEAKDPNLKRLKKRVVKETPREEDTTKVPAEQEVTEQDTKKRKSGHVKTIARKRPRPQPDDDSDDEHRKCLKIVTFDNAIDSEVIKTKSFISRLHKVSSPDGDYLVIYRANGHFRAFNYLMDLLYIFDRKDLFHLYDLVIKQYPEITPEDIELILWGDLKIMMESSTEENDQGDFWNNQQEWEIVRWRLYEACGVYILKLKDRTIIYMLVERRYPLSKELLQQMIDLGLEVEEERLSIHLVYNEELAIPEQMTNGKGISNPLMADSLPKTTKPT
ncbi:hypothetical protein Tco_0842015 [Tanacetum coccineum]|uniref:Uncharacterized protein n=1 Tax=Tanacetum coccineum TaxID=301880 RepID=A0ABQ5AZD1_9ASTR